MKRYIANLIGLYFRLQDKYPGVCKKIALSIQKLLEFRDSKKLDQWLFKEAEWNKEVYAKLLKNGYNSSLWDEGIREHLPVEGIGKDIATKMRQQTHQLIELTDEHKIEVDASYKEKGLSSYQEAKEFAEKYLLNNERLPQEIRDLIRRILNATKDFEERYKNQVLSSAKVTVEITPDFLKDTYSGVGIPGCFTPHGGHNEMPVIHSLETNSLFLRIYDENNKMIANAVLVLTLQGVVVQPLYNASNLDLNRVVLEGLAELLLQDMVPAVLFSDESSAAKEALKYARTEKITAVNMKKNTLDAPLYFDFSSSDSFGMIEFKMIYKLTKEDLKDFKSFTDEEIKEVPNQEKEKRLSKEDRKEITQELFYMAGLKDIEIGPVLKNIEKIMFELEESKIEEIVASLFTRSFPKQGISETEKVILKGKLLEIKGRILKQLESVVSSALEKGQPLCLTPDSLITLADGTTKPLIELSATKRGGSAVASKASVGGKPLSTYAVNRGKEDDGDMVLSLNEATGRLEPHRVLALLDMGVKPVYRITTESGKTLKTTLIHPYLTKNGWRKLQEIGVGEEVAVAGRVEKSNPQSNRKLSPTKEAIGLGLKAGEEVGVVEDKVLGAQRIKGRKTAGLCGLKQSGADIRADEDGVKFFKFNSDSKNNGIIAGEIVAEDKLVGLNDISRGDFNNSDFIQKDVFTEFAKSGLKICKGYFSAVFNPIKSGNKFCQADVGNNDLGILFLKDFDYNFAPNFPVVALHEGGGIKEIGHLPLEFIPHLTDFFGYASADFREAPMNFFQGNGFLGEPFSGDIISTSFYGESHSDEIINSNLAFCYRHNFFSAFIFKYNTLISGLSRLLLGRAEAAQVPEVSTGSDILWDKIISIEPLGPMQVYDIEVEATHNFIAEGIVAHNTYTLGEQTVSSAMEDKKGGIDLNPQNLEMEIKGKGTSPVFMNNISFDIQNFQGFSFQIISIQPVKEG